MERNLSVTTSGLVTDSLRRPILTLQLSPDEHRRPLPHFSNFLALEDTYDENDCYDGVL